MARPSAVPRWADGVSAQILEPSSGKKDSGWTVEQPSHETLNWWMNAVYQWQQHFDEMNSHVWHVKEGFADGGGWDAEDLFYRIASDTGGDVWVIPLHLPAGLVISASNLSWRVQPAGATNTITCGLQVYNDDTLALSTSRESSTGSSAETVLGSAGMTTVTGALPFTMGTNGRAFARFVANGAGTSDRKAYWFRFNHAG